LNNDGRPDIVAGNLGTNTQFRVSEKQPLELYFGDIDANGIIDPVLSFYIQGKRYPYMTRDELLAQVPSFRKRFSTFSSYADVTLDDLLTSDQQRNLGHVVADHMETTVFLSGAGKYKAAVLPDEVQYAPVHSVIISDLNKDGNADILFFGNDSRMKIRLGKWDANYGTLVLGNGKGEFKYVSQPGSGFMIHGDVRSSILLGDIVLAGVNGGKLVSYKRNETAK
jgi:enediyne biosynthesis protein E4